jgi:hypothetical protein
MSRSLSSATAALAAIALVLGLATPALADDSTPPPAPTGEPAPSPSTEPSTEPPLAPPASDPPEYGDFSNPPADNSWSTPAPAPATFDPPAYRVPTAEERADFSRRAAAGFAWFQQAAAAYAAAGMSQADAQAAASADLNAITMAADFDLHPYLPAFRMRGAGEAAPTMPATTVSRTSADPASAVAAIEVAVASTVSLKLHNLAGRSTVVTLEHGESDPVNRVIGPNRTATVRVHLDANAPASLTIAGSENVESGVTAHFAPLPTDGWEHVLTRR